MPVLASKRDGTKVLTQRREVGSQDCSGIYKHNFSFAT